MLKEAPLESGWIGISLDFLIPGGIIKMLTFLTDKKIKLSLCSQIHLKSQRLSKQLEIETLSKRHYFLDQRTQIVISNKLEELKMQETVFDH